MWSRVQNIWLAFYHKQCSYYPPRWYWPIVRIFGGLHQANRGVYMTRTILTPRVFGYQLYFHVFHRADGDRDPHDHPFGFWTCPLFQGYTETVYDPVKACFTDIHVPAFEWTYRPAKHTHRVIAADRGWPLMTLVLRGPNERKWGFWCHPDHAHEDNARWRFWVPWRNYVDEGENANNDGIDESCPGKPE